MSYRHNFLVLFSFYFMYFFFFFFFLFLILFAIFTQGYSFCDFLALLASEDNISYLFGYKTWFSLSRMTTNS